MCNTRSLVRQNYVLLIPNATRRLCFTYGRNASLLLVRPLSEEGGHLRGGHLKGVTWVKKEGVTYCGESLIPYISVT